MIQRILKDKYKTTEWSGGKTSEILIYPEGSDFKANDYQTRISMASIEVDESNFTPLPGVERTLTLLEGELQLSINDRGFVPLQQYLPVSFYGGDKTESRGKAVDFNFMKRNQDPHEVNVMQVDQQERIVLLPNYKNSLLFIIDGKAECSEGVLNKHDSLFFDEELMVIIEAKTLFIKVDF